MTQDVIQLLKSCASAAVELSPILGRHGFKMGELYWQTVLSEKKVSEPSVVTDEMPSLVVPFVRQQNEHEWKVRICCSAEKGNASVVADINFLIDDKVVAVAYGDDIPDGRNDLLAPVTDSKRFIDVVQALLADKIIPMFDQPVENLLKLAGQRRIIHILALAALFIIFVAFAFIDTGGK